MTVEQSADLFLTLLNQFHQLLENLNFKKKMVKTFNVKAHSSFSVLTASSYIMDAVPGFKEDTSPVYVCFRRRKPWALTHRKLVLTCQNLTD